LPLQTYRRVATTDAEAASEAIGRIFCPHDLQPARSDAQDFYALHHCAPFDGFSVSFVAYGGTVAIDPGCLDRFFLIQVPLSGSATVATAGQEIATRPGDTASLLSPTVPTRMVWRDDCSQAILLIDRDIVEQRAAALAGAVRQAVEFAPSIDLRQACGRQLAIDLSEFVSIADRLPRGRGLSALAAADWRERMVGTLLTGQSHGLSSAIRSFSGQVAPVALRRARDYIQANADQPFDLARLAMVSGVGIRALQVNFRRHFGCTVSQMQREIRLDHLNRRLLAAADDDSVTTIAYDLGFTHLSRMAEAYRAKFGESPSATLGRRIGRS